jgi:hypothetical protein
MSVEGEAQVTELNTEAKQVLWLDDYVGSYTSQLNALEMSGLEVTISNAIPSPESILTGGIRNIILDNKFGEAGLSDGYRFIELLKGSNYGERRVVFYSAYISDSDAGRRVETDPVSKLAILYLPKAMAKRADRTARDQAFAACLLQFFSASFEKIEALDLEPLFHKKAAATEKSFQEFTGLDRQEQSLILKQLSDDYTGAAQKVFAKGATWVVFLSGEKQPHSSSLVGGKMPKPEDVLSIGASRNKIPVVFEVGLAVDDLSCASEGALGDLDTYPRAAIYFSGSHAEGEPTEIHFDTGSDKNFFSANFVREVGLAEVIEGGEKTVIISGHPYYSELVEWDVFLLAQDEPSRMVYQATLEGYSVADWAKKPLMLRCSTACSRTSSKGDLCVFRRNGLIGRPLLRSFGGSALVKQRGGRIALIRDKEK